MLRSLPAALLVAALAPQLASQGWAPGPTVPTTGNAPRPAATALQTPFGFLLMGGAPVDANGDTPVQRLSGTSWLTTTPLEGDFLYRGTAVDDLGRVIVFGGIDSGGGGGDSYQYTVADGDAGGINERSGQAPDAYFGVATDDQARIYSIGGAAAGTPTVAAANGRVERYDGAADSWSVLAALPTPVADVAATADGQGHILACGGFDVNGVRTANVARYDIATGTWSDTAVPDMPAARSGAEAVLGADGRVYVLGGSDGAPTATVFVYDPFTNTWSNGPSMGHAREHCASTLDIDGNVWAIGGTTTNTSESLFTPTCPRILDGPTVQAAWLGTAAGITLTVEGTAPISYQWRRDGLPLVDGPTGNGSRIVGAQTASLGILGVTQADVGSFDCVVDNACNRPITSDPATLTLQIPPSLATTFTARSLHSAHWTSSDATSIDGGHVVGSVGYVHPQYNGLSKPALWVDGQGAAVDLTPANSVGGAAAKIRGDMIVGWWWWPYTTPLGTGYNRNASGWTNRGQTHHQLQTSGWEFGSIVDTDGAHHVGSQTRDETSLDPDGFYWPTNSRSARGLTPSGYRGSSGVALDGDFQYGSTHIAFGTVHAARWQGSGATFFDMNPPGASRSAIIAAGDGLQVGSATIGGTAITGLWAGGPSTFMPLTPNGATAASPFETRYGLFVGTVTGPNGSGAAVWKLDGSGWVDLHASLPAHYTSSAARDLWLDPSSGVLHIVGYARNGTAGRNEAIHWTAANDLPAVTRLGTSCPTTLRFTPRAGGGYTVTRVVPAWIDDNLGGQEIGAGAVTDQGYCLPVNLGFGFPMPNGTTATQLRIGDNARIFDLAQYPAQDAAAADPVMLRAGPSCLAPLWTDLRSSAGSVRALTEPGLGRATITWRDVPQVDSTARYTFQTVLRTDGSFDFTYADTIDWTADAGTPGRAVVVGCTAGNGAADPGASDFLQAPLAAGSEVYQAWSATGPGPDLQRALRATSLPVVGTTLDIACSGVTGATSNSLLLVGLLNPDLDLAPIGLWGCRLFAGPDAIALPMTAAGSSATASIPVPNDPALVGVDAPFLQSVDFANGESALGIVPSNGLAVRIGR